MNSKMMKRYAVRQDRKMGTRWIDDSEKWTDDFKRKGYMTLARAKEIKRIERKMYKHDSIIEVCEIKVIEEI